jgi:hypothetical protein
MRARAFGFVRRRQICGRSSLPGRFRNSDGQVFLDKNKSVTPDIFATT